MTEAKMLVGAKYAGTVWSMDDNKLIFQPFLEDSRVELAPEPAAILYFLGLQQLLLANPLHFNPVLKSTAWNPGRQWYRNNTLIIESSWVINNKSIIN